MLNIKSFKGMRICTKFRLISTSRAASLTSLRCRLTDLVFLFKILNYYYIHNITKTQDFFFFFLIQCNLTLILGNCNTLSINLFCLKQLLFQCMSRLAVFAMCQYFKTCFFLIFTVHHSQLDLPVSMFCSELTQLWD